MQAFVLLKLSPDTVDELTVAADGKSLETEALRFKLGDSDEHALEQALLLKEKYGGTVTAVALEALEVDDVLFTALAKGADRAVKLSGEFTGSQSHAAAGAMGSFLQSGDAALPADALILLRSQAIDDLDGEIGPFLADLLGVPYVGGVTGVAVAGEGLLVTKEFAGGLRGEFTLPLPAVLGIQSAEKPPRYVPIAKVRAAMKSGRMETAEIPLPATPASFTVERMYKPQAAGRAEMLEGAPEIVADRLVAVLAKNNLI
ncbi:MAG: electron transfer flavoprotein subunit beta [Verrucomicrobia bacterium]|nr:electron transfer flavoprotein subunit beta [Verrucomicrobiota bacterium]